MPPMTFTWEGATRVDGDPSPTWARLRQCSHHMGRPNRPTDRLTVSRPRLRAGRTGPPVVMPTALELTLLQRGCAPSSAGIAGSGIVYEKPCAPSGVIPGIRVARSSRKYSRARLRASAMRGLNIPLRSKLQEADTFSVDGPMSARLAVATPVMLATSKSSGLMSMLRSARIAGLEPFGSQWTLTGKPGASPA